MRITIVATLCLATCIAAQEVDELETVVKNSTAEDLKLTNVPINKSVPIPDGRIVGGQVAEIEAFPYQIAMAYFGKHTCGGSIIRYRVVVTAAHCVKNKSLEQLKVRAGSNRHNVGGVLVGVEQVVVHSGFGLYSMANDIALVVLQEDLTFGQAIQAVDLASTADFVGPDTALLVSGWGSTKEGGKTSPVLRYVQVGLIDHLACTRSYRKSGKGVVNRNMMCAGILRGERDSCQGDSGGPLVVHDGSRTILHGIVSWGYGCARPTYPGVYTKVAGFNEWITSNLRDLGYL